MSDGNYLRGENDVRFTTEAALAVNKILQARDGSAAVLKGQSGASANDGVNVETRGQFTCTKATGFVGLDGGRAYWDHSALNVTYKRANDRDFYLGRFVGDSASGDTTCTVNFNIPENAYDIDLTKDAFLSVPTGTQVVGVFGFPKTLGGAQSIELGATNEAQSIDLLSVDRFAVSANPILEAIIRVPVNGTDSTVDFNIGLANGTSTTNADDITESVFFHIDGGALDILAESDDGTTEVNATDTTVNFTAGSAVANRVELWIDARDLTSVKLYVDGVRVLSGSTFKLDAATGPLGALAHLEKTAGTATGKVVIDRLSVRYGQQ